MDWQLQTIKTYDKSATELAEYFKGVGARIKDIELGLKLSKSGNTSRIIEIGCGDGRDAQEIVKLVNWYEGCDPSIELLNLARKKVPGASFVLADALSYVYPSNVDVIFAFASLLHVNKIDLVKVFNKTAKSLKQSGILYISLKERPEYTEEVKRDKYGERMFYYYNPSIIKDLSRENFQSAYEAHQKIGHTDWFTIALYKR